MPHLRLNHKLGLSVPALLASGFVDVFGGSASDPSLDASLWTQNTRTGTSNVNTTVAGKAVCRRFSGAVSGRFTAYVTALWENGVVDFYTVRGLVFGMVDSLNNASFIFRQNQKDQTQQDGTGLGAGDKGYRLDLAPEGAGAVGQFYRSDNGAYAPVGAAFTCTGLDATTPRDVTIIVATLADRVRVTVRINGSTVATIDDTTAGWLAAPGYGGFSHFASQALGGAAVDMDGFEVNN